MSTAEPRFPVSSSDFALASLSLEPATCPDPSVFRVTLVRGPIVSTLGAVNNEATPCLGLAYLAGYLRKHGYAVTIVDSIGEGLNRYWPSEEHAGYICQGLPFAEVLDRVPADTRVIGFSAMFSGEWPIQRGLLRALRDRFPNALIVAGGEHLTALPEVLPSRLSGVECLRTGGGRAAALRRRGQLADAGRLPRRRRHRVSRRRRPVRPERPAAPRQGRGHNSVAVTGPMAIWRTSGARASPMACVPSATCHSWFRAGAHFNVRFARVPRCGLRFTSCAIRTT